MENGRFADGKAIHRLMEKDRPFPQDGKPLSHSAAIRFFDTTNHIE